MKIFEVGYLAITAKNLDEWRTFAADYVGFEVRSLDDGCLGLRMDEYPWRIVIKPAQEDGVGIIGMRVADQQALETVRKEMTAAGFAVNESTDAERATRNVAHMLWVLDPDGNRGEFFAGRSADPSPFKPGRPIGGFRTGSLGFGHFVLGSPNFEALEHFYMKLLGFRLSDYFDTGDLQVRFLHVNGRHHSLALSKEPKKFLHHIMVEYKFLDDLGRLYDKAHDMPAGTIQTTLGRHDNDNMLSFYTKTPGGFLLETGWGGRTIDSENWNPRELWCFSLWGHVRHWAPPEMRAKNREEKEIAARKGMLAPVETNDEGGFIRRNTI